MHRRGHEVLVVQPLPLAPDLPGHSQWAELASRPVRELRYGIPVRRPRYVHIPGHAFTNARRFTRAGLEIILAGERPSAVIADYAWPAAAAALRLRDLQIPFVIHGRGSDVLQVAGEAGLGHLLAEYLHPARHWCAVSRDLVSAMDHLGGWPGRGRLIPNGVDLELFDIADRDQARQHLGLPADRVLVLVVGHLIERKDPLLALSTFTGGAPADALCVFIGRGPLRRRLARRVRRLGLENRVRLAGEVPPATLARWYAAADCLLLTSRREGRPNVVLEALASGRPVLATAAGGTAELLADFDGMLARTRDPEILAEMLTGLLAAPRDPTALRALVSDLTWDRSLDALEDCLAETIGEG